MLALPCRSYPSLHLFRRKDKQLFSLRFLDSSWINSILERGKVPILVGGTNQYIEEVIWDSIDVSETSQEIGDDPNLSRATGEVLADPEVSKEV